MRRFLIALASVAALGSPLQGAHAQSTPATEESIRELMELTGAANLAVQMVQQMLPSLKRSLPQAPESFWVEFMNEVDPDELIALVIPIYQRNLTEEEVRETVRFYQSRAGKKVIQAMPKIMQESMGAGEQWGQMLARRVIERMKAPRPKSL